MTNPAWQPVVVITSPKHPGAVFIKRNGTASDFICKVYPNHSAEAEVVRRALNIYYNQLAEVEVANPTSD